MRLNQEITKVKTTEGTVVTEDPYVSYMIFIQFFFKKVKLIIMVQICERLK